MNLSDKLGELKSAFGWQINRLPSEQFTVTVWTKPKFSVGPTCSFETQVHDNLYKAVDEAIDLLREHLSDCSLC